MSVLRRTFAVVAFVVPSLLVAQTPKVGPARGTVIVVGGGGMGPEVYNEFIKSAGGPDALILIIPNAGGADTYAGDAGTRGWKQAGAKNVQALFTKDRKLADTDSFVAIIKKAGGIWFEGGRQFHLVDDYGGTKTETEFMNVLNRGGVIAGSSAGASILGDFLVRGAPSNNNMIMDDPSHQKGFVYLKNVGIDQHVVARERLPDLADSIIPTHPNLLAISEDEGTAWVVRGDTAMIIGRNKAFVYGARVANDPGNPFLTLHPGDRFDLANRKVTHRALDDSPVSLAFVDDLFKKYSNASAGGATVLVSQDGKVFIDHSYGIAAQAKYMPKTTVPQFSLGEMSKVFSEICAQVPEPAGRGGGAGAAGAGAAGGGRANAGPPQTPFQNCITRRVSTPIGMHKTNGTPDGDVMSDVDELYRLDLGLQNRNTYGRDTTGANGAFDPARGWESDSFKGATRLSVFGKPGGKRAAFVRFPEKRAAIIILTNDDSADAKGMAEKIADRLLSPKGR